MDSLTQIVLGAAVGEAVLGKEVGSRAMLWGAVAGTIPDLDVLLRYTTDEISSTELHRGFSHSIVFAILISPLLAFIAKKIHHKWKEASFKNWCWLFFWATVTHPLLDAHTTWGTQFFWPFEYRLAYQNIFVIDPLYTLPFLTFTLIAMFHKRTNPKRRKFNNWGLIVSSSYMVIALFLKWYTFTVFEKSLENQNIEYTDLDTKPSPLNTILWTSVVETESGYRTGAYSIFDTQEIQFSREFSKNHHLIAPYKEERVIQQLINISRGWYYIEELEDRLVFWDVRFGQFGMDLDNAPFVWSYDIFIEAGKIKEVVKNQPAMTDMGEAISDLWERIKGN
ncbi:MAG: metal-dependent hydrolase [Crocinitomicaceae bacterium]|nr:metal-dependent hydrolase [Crocinitomicaceae bacterium]